MLGLPRSTEVNRRVSKERLYANASLTPQVRGMIRAQIESILWRNKLAESTIAISEGEDVKEIQIFEVLIRQRELDRRVLPAIAKAIPYKILFILVLGDEANVSGRQAQACIEASGTFYNTEWQALDELALRFEGLNLDAVYENLARQISGGRLGADVDIGEAVDRDKRRQKLERDIAALEKKILNEKQFNRQVELNAEVKRFKKELEGLW